MSQNSQRPPIQTLCRSSEPDLLNFALSDSLRSYDLGSKKRRLAYLVLLFVTVMQKFQWLPLFPFHQRSLPQREHLKTWNSLFHSFGRPVRVLLIEMVLQQLQFSSVYSIDIIYYLVSSSRFSSFFICPEAPVEQQYTQPLIWPDF